MNYGLKILSYEAASIFLFNEEIEMKYDTKETLFANSLLNDFLNRNNLKKCKKNREKWTNDKNGQWTRDIISVKFNYGIRDYKTEINKIEKNKKIDDKRKNELIEKVTKQKKKYQKKSIEELRKYYYINGIKIKYNDKELEYRMLYRTTSKAKTGSCIFIKASLYEMAKKFLRMGKQFKDEESKILEIGAYQSLVASTIIGRVKINPKNILVIKDIDTFFERKVVSFMGLLDEKNIPSEEKLKEKMKSTLFDGQSLIDTSIFKNSSFIEADYKLNGFILLRQHFFKSAAFCTDIKSFFKDYCNEHDKEYETFTVKDYWGVDHYVKDIELITTENSMKWMKFSNSIKDFEYWSAKVLDSDSKFGIVKTAKESRQCNYQRMSYQMVNILDNDKEKLKKILQCSCDYIDRVNESESRFLDGDNSIDDYEIFDFLQNNATFYNCNEVLIELCKKNRYFLQSNFFRERKKHLIEEYKNELKKGHIIQDAENLYIVGSPYAMLLVAAGEEYSNDTMFKIETGENAAIQCYTERFDNGTMLAEFRSPFNSRNNIGYMRNVYPSEKIRKYFKGFGRNIIAVNMIGSDFQARNNGSDQDSDFIYTTAQPEIVECARKFYHEYPTIINDSKDEVLNDKKKCENILEKYAEIDYKLTNTKDEIGKWTNLAQLCLTYSYNEKDTESKNKFEKFVCILSVLAQISIDKAKRNFKINLDDIKKMEDEIDEVEKKKKYPVFFKSIKNEKIEEDRINNNLECPMNVIHGYAFPKSKERIKKREMLVFFSENTNILSSNIKKNIKKIENEVTELANSLIRTQLPTEKDNDEDEIKYKLLNVEYEEKRQKIQEFIRKANIQNSEIFAKLLSSAFGISRNIKNKSLLLKILYDIDKEAFLKCFKSTEEMNK